MTAGQPIISIRGAVREDAGLILAFIGEKILGLPKSY